MYHQLTNACAPEHKTNTLQLATIMMVEHSDDVPAMSGQVKRPESPLPYDDDDDSLLEEHGIRANYVTERFTFYRRPCPTSEGGRDHHLVTGTEDGARSERVSSPCSLVVEACSATTTTGGQLTSEGHDATGILIWPATHLLCQEIVGGIHILRPSEERPVAVAELGCGVGLVGVTALKAWPSSIKIWASTDMDERSLRLCRRNFRLNGTDVDRPSSSQAWVRPLQWGDSESIQSLIDDLHDRTGLSRFDEVIGADIVYPSTSDLVLRQLLSTVDALLRPEGTFWLSFATRDGVKTPLRLIEAVSHAGFRVDALDPLDDATKRRLPPLLDSKVLALRRDSQAGMRNQDLGGDSCRVFPGLQAKAQRIAEPSSDDEWDAPFADDDA